MSEDILTRPAPPADLRLRYGPGPLHFGDLWLPTGPGPHPVVVAIHGGFWRATYDLAHMGHLCAALAADGIAAWNVEYRRLGDAGGGWPGTFHDVARATDYLRALAPAHDLDLARVVPLGFSAGGHLALWLAARRRIPPDDPLHASDPLPIRAAASLAGVVDLRRAWELRLSDGVVETFMGGPPGALPDRYVTASPSELLPLGVPQALVHGVSDENVPYELSCDYHAAANARGDEATLTTLPATGHFEPIDPCAPQWPAVIAAIRPLLGHA